jgi:alpha-maltose-1-phosphate synthase
VVAPFYSRATAAVAKSLANCATFAVSSGSPVIKTLLAHPGTQYSAQLARQLHRNNCLHRFWTSFALPENSLFERTLRQCMRTPPNWLGNRVVDHVPADKIRTVPSLELMALLRHKFGTEAQIALHERNERFQRTIPQSELQSSDVVIGFDTSSNILIDRTASIERPFVLDQTIAHPRSKNRVYNSIRRQFPNWSADLEIRADAVSAAENAEHAKATQIVVASSFTKATLIEHGVSADKIALNPYGVDLARFSLKPRSHEKRPFRFLFAGLVSARKGIPLLLESWKTLAPKNAELWIVGPVSPTAPSTWLDGAGINFLGKVSNVELAGIMAESDVFVFPSYFEGFALVLLEAMASGLPVITTTATAGPDIISHDQDGWVIEPGNLDALIEAMRFCLENRDRVTEMGIKARATAEKFSWDAYGDRWIRILEAVAGR